MSDTPRTDALITRYIPRNDGEGVTCIVDIADVAAMERELSQMTAMYDSCRKANEGLRKQIADYVVSEKGWLEPDDLRDDRQ
jgi:hypothetical protein